MEKCSVSCIEVSRKEEIKYEDQQVYIMNIVTLKNLSVCSVESVSYTETITYNSNVIVIGNITDNNEGFHFELPAPGVIELKGLIDELEPYGEKIIQYGILIARIDQPGIFPFTSMIRLSKGDINNISTFRWNITVVEIKQNVQCRVSCKKDVKIEISAQSVRDSPESELVVSGDMIIPQDLAIQFTKIIGLEGIDESTGESVRIREDYTGTTLLFFSESFFQPHTSNIYKICFRVVEVGNIDLRKNIIFTLNDIEKKGGDCEILNVITLNEDVIITVDAQMRCCRVCAKEDKIY